MKIKVYSIWSEDQCSWFPDYLVTSKEEVLKAIEDKLDDVQKEWPDRDFPIELVEAELDITELMEDIKEGVYGPLT